MKKLAPPKVQKFPAAKQRRLDKLLDRNSEGTITAKEKGALEQLVVQAEQLMVVSAFRRKHEEVEPFELLEPLVRCHQLMSARHGERGKIGIHPKFWRRFRAFC